MIITQRTITDPIGDVNIDRIVSVREGTKQELLKYYQLDILQFNDDLRIQLMVDKQFPFKMALENRSVKDQIETGRIVNGCKLMAYFEFVDDKHVNLVAEWFSIKE